MVLWLLANDGDISRVDEFLHLYRLRLSMHSSYWELKPWDVKSRLVFDSSSSLCEWKKNLFVCVCVCVSPVMAGRSLQMKIWIIFLS